MTNAELIQLARQGWQTARSLAVAHNMPASEKAAKRALEQLEEYEEELACRAATEIKEHDVVETTTAGLGLAKGARGTVVHVYASGDVELEVEGRTALFSRAHVRKVKP